LKKGKSFTAIAAKLFADPVLAGNGGDLGWVNWDDLEYDLAMAAFRLKPDSFSVPVRSQFGYHILKTTDYKKKPLITRQEYEKAKAKAEAKLEFMLGDKYAQQYINELMQQSEIEIIPEIATAVRSKLKNIFKRNPDQFSRMTEMQLTNDEVRMIERNLWDMRNEIFAIINGKEFSVGEFIGALNYIPYNILYSSFRKAMNYAFRDFLINEEARDLGLQDSEKVMLKYKLFREYLLQQVLRTELIAGVEVARGEIQSYYELNKTKYKGAGLAQVEKIIRDILIREKKSETVPRFIEGIIETKTIIKYPEVIHKYYDSILN